MSTPSRGILLEWFWPIALGYFVCCRSLHRSQQFLETMAFGFVVNHELAHIICTRNSEMWPWMELCNKCTTKCLQGTESEHPRLRYIACLPHPSRLLMPSWSSATAAIAKSNLLRFVLCRLSGQLSWGQPSANEWGSLNFMTAKSSFQLFKRNTGHHNNIFGSCTVTQDQLLACFKLTIQSSFDFWGHMFKMQWVYQGKGWYPE